MPYLAKPPNPVFRRKHPLAAGVQLAFHQSHPGTDPRDGIYGATAVRTGAVTWVREGFGPVLRYPANAGNNDYTQVPFDSRYDLTNKDWSFGFVVTPTGGGASGYKVIANQGGSVSDLRIYFLLNPSNILYRYGSFSSGFVMTMGITYRVLYTFVPSSVTANTGTETFYVDGARVAQASGLGAIAASSAPITFGATPGGHSFQGTLDAMTLWVNRALSASQAAQWCTDPWCLWRPQVSPVVAFEAPAPAGPSRPVLMAGYRRRRTG